jgi:hypothetical protein
MTVVVYLARLVGVTHNTAGNVAGRQPSTRSALPFALTPGAFVGRYLVRPIVFPRSISTKKAPAAPGRSTPRCHPVAPSLLHPRRIAADSLNHNSSIPLFGPTPQPGEHLAYLQIVQQEMVLPRQGVPRRRKRDFLPVIPMRRANASTRPPQSVDVTGFKPFHAHLFQPVVLRSRK